MGEYLARGLHLPVHVAPLPNPLRGTLATYLPDHTAECDPVADGAENLLARDSNGRDPQICGPQLPGTCNTGVTAS